MKYLLGIDFGGGASKATLLGEDGVIAATHMVEYPTHYPQNGYAEQNPHDWYEAVKKNISQILAKSGAGKEDIAALCLDAATHTAVLTDKDGEVLRPAIYWTDSRSTSECEYIKENFEKTVLEKALHSVDTIWTLPQLMWVKRNEPQVWSRLGKIFFPKDYIRYLLTGEYCTDYIEAEGSMLFDYNTLKWSDELCKIIGLDMSILPPVVSPIDFVGKITEKAASETGLSQKTKVICGTTDTALEVFASGAVRKSDMTVKLATAGRICIVTGKSYPHKHMINYSHIEKGLWYPGTATKSCAASYRWYRDTFGGDYKALDSDAANVPVGCEGLMFHPYLNGELTPYADPKLCASFTGIRASHTKPHFSRAVMEGVAMSLIDCKTVFDELGIEFPKRANIIGGGSESPVWRQIIADALGIELELKQCSDSSFGGAMLAGIAVGIWNDLSQAVAKCSKTLSVTSPCRENTIKYAQLYKRYKKIHDALAPVYNENPQK